MLYDLVSSTEVLPQQHLLMMGFCVPGLAPAPLSIKYFPWPRVLALDQNPCDTPWPLISENQIRELAGNGFHISLIGAMMLFGLATAALTDDHVT